MDYVKSILDGAAIGAAIGGIAGLLPPIATILSIVWLGIQIYDRVRLGPRNVVNDVH